MLRMDIPASQCKSGCESGWTLYLDQSSISEHEWRRGGMVGDDGCGRKNALVAQQAEEDLSMVSDASSGPPHFHEEEDCYDGSGCVYSSSQAPKKGKKKNTKDKHPCTKLQHSSLDDTASSPVLSFSKKFSATRDQASMERGLDFSQGFSATHFKGKSAFQKQIDFFKSPFADKTPSDTQGSCEGRSGNEI